MTDATILQIRERRSEMRRMLSRIFAEPIEIAFANELGWLPLPVSHHDMPVSRSPAR